MLFFLSFSVRSFVVSGLWVKLVGGVFAYVYAQSLKHRRKGVAFHVGKVDALFS